MQNNPMQSHYPDDSKESRHRAVAADSWWDHPRALREVWGQETIGAVIAAVDHIELRFLGIVEEEEIVTKQLHLSNRLFRVHRLDRKPFRPHNRRELFVLIGPVKVRVKIAVDGQVGHASTLPV